MLITALEDLYLEHTIVLNLAVLNLISILFIGTFLLHWCYSSKIQVDGRLQTRRV